MPEVVKANVWQSVDYLFKGSPVVRNRVMSEVLKVIGDIYLFEDGHVEWLGNHPKQENLLRYTGGGHLCGVFLIIDYEN